MPPPPNKLVRTLVPLGVVVIGLGVAVSVFMNKGKPQTPPPAPAKAATPVAPTPPSAAVTPPPNAQTPPIPAAPSPEAQPVTATPPRTGLHAQAVPAAPLATIGSIDPDGADMVFIEFSSLGSGIKSMQLARHFDTIRRDKDKHTVIQREHSFKPTATSGDPNPQESLITPMAALGVEIDGKEVSLLNTVDAAGIVQPVWKQTAPGAFEATILDSADKPVARISRRYAIQPGSYVVHVDQTISNLTDKPFNTRWIQFGPTELEQDAAGYGGDKRRLRFAYLLKPEVQRGDPTVSSSDFVLSRADSHVLGTKDKATGDYPELLPVWPNQLSTREQYRLVWAGLTNRYFAAAVTPLVQPGAGPDAKVFHAAEKVDRITLPSYAMIGGTLTYDPVIILRLTSEAIAVPAGQGADMSMGLYAGPLERPLIRKDPVASATSLDGLVIYNFGGMCGPCTFTFLTSFLLALLHFLHDTIVFDWALSIMVLVLIVRTLLHPVTKWSQIRMQRFGKQMQGMAPKQKLVQQKYADDPKRQREEMAKLWKEEGISPTGALGCIPMFLQTPVWIALYATLYFAVELRHQGAFFGVFQTIFPNHPKFGGWFLGDLAEPDRFYYFGRDIVNLPLLGPIASINVLPIILGVVFFIQQKYLTPPSTTPLTPEQEQQQKIMKWMMVFMFPLMMYNAPSGLALYFIVNSSLGILESRYIRAHVAKLDLLKPPEKGPKKRSGFLGRLQEMAEQRQQQMLKAKGQYPPRKKV